MKKKLKLFSTHTEFVAVLENDYAYTDIGKSKTAVYAICMPFNISQDKIERKNDCKKHLPHPLATQRNSPSRTIVKVQHLSHLIISYRFC